MKGYLVKRNLMIVFVVLMMFAVMAVGSAGAKGVPNDNACHGQTVAGFVSGGDSLQATLADIGGTFGWETVGDMHKFNKYDPRSPCNVPPVD